MSIITEKDRQKVLQNVIDTLRASGQFPDETKLNETAVAFENKTFKEATSPTDYICRINKKLSKVKAMSTSTTVQASTISVHKLEATTTSSNSYPQIATATAHTSVESAEHQFDDLQWFSKNSSSLHKMLEKRRALENLQIEGIDIRELMLRLHRILKGTNPSVEDIAYVRGHIHIAIAFLKNRAQKATSKIMGPSTMIKTEPIDNMECIDIAKSLEYLGKIQDKQVSSITLCSKLKEEIYKQPEIGTELSNLAKHIAIIHYRLQCLSDILSLIPKSQRRAMPSVSKHAAEEELMNLGIFTSDQYTRAANSCVGNDSVRTLRDQIITAHCCAPMVLTNCMSRMNEIVRIFNAISIGAIQIGRMAPPNCRVIWAPPQMDSFGDIVFIQPRNVSIKNADSIERCFQLLIRNISNFIQWTKQLFSDNKNGTVTPDAPIQLTDCNNFLRHNSSTSVLKKRDYTECKSSGEPCLKRCRMSPENSGDNSDIFFCRFGFGGNKDCDRLDEKVNISWLDEFLTTLRENHIVKCKAFRKMNNTEELCSLLLCVDKVNHGSTLLELLCDKNGFPVKVQCWDEGCTESESTCQPLVENTTAYKILLTKLIEYRCASDSKVSAETAVKELVNMWLNHNAVIHFV